MARKKSPADALKRSTLLRERAEELLRAKDLDQQTIPIGDVHALVHELTVYQVELELQNEELRQAQVELAQSRDRYSDLYEFSPLGYLTLNQHGRILEANLMAATMLGVERTYLLQSNMTRFVARQSQDDFYRHRQAFIADELKHVCELEMHHPDGLPRVMLLESVASGFGGDRQIRTALVDITQRKQVERKLVEQERFNRATERELKVSREQLSTLMKTAADAVITIDESGTMQFVNQAAERMFGYSADELLGQNVRILIPSPYQEEHDGYLKRYLETGVKRIIGIGREATGLRKNGNIFPLDISVSEVDHLNIFMGVLRDISQRKHLERQVVEIASLEQQRIGQDLHDSIGQQLTGMILLTQLLTESARKLERQENESDVRQRAIPLPKLSDQAARLRVGLEEALQDIRTVCTELTPVPINADGLMAALGQLVAKTSSQSSVICTFCCPVPIALLDNVTATHLYNIALGALSNALRHAQARTIQVSLEQTGKQLALSIRDDGIGLPPNRLIGLGLRIMENRAQIIGGNLAIRTVQPTGTEVTCIFPTDAKHE